MNSPEPTENDHRARSIFIRALVQQAADGYQSIDLQAPKPQRRIVQFWDDLNRLPTDVADCMDTWRTLEAQGIERSLFDHISARDFIAQKLGARHLNAYSKCYHPAMQSDYFRLCYLYVEGGGYVDADDVYHGEPIGHLFDDGRLKVQPLCYDISTDAMIGPGVFTEPGADAPSWIFYLNNNPLIAVRRNPIIRRSLMSATTALERPTPGNPPEIQSTTGPGNLTKSVFKHALQGGIVANDLFVINSWEGIATSKWPLSYRQDARNWRLANQQIYLSPLNVNVGDGQ